MIKRLAVTVVLVTCIAFLLSRWVYRPFDSQVWKNDTYCTGVRRTMLRDLVRKHHLIGLKKEEIVKLLGKPSDPSFPFGAAGWDMVYCLGPSGMDHQWLFLRLKNDVVTEMRSDYVD